MNAGESKLTILSHLAELRGRLIKSVIAIAIGAAICFIFYQWLFYILILPAKGINLIYVEMTEMVGTIMKVSIFAGIALTMPFLVYQGIMFLAPALTPREKKYVYLVLPWVALMFIIGVVFGYFVLIPPAVKFLITFGSEIAAPQIKIGNYISIVTRLLLYIGLVFELPVITTFLARIGIIKARWLEGKRKAAIIGAFILAALITPTFDPINQSLVAVPLIILYELSIWLARLVQRRTGQPQPVVVE